jgi:hypothetical protein
MKRLIVTFWLLIIVVFTAKAICVPIPKHQAKVNAHPKTCSISNADDSRVNHGDTPTPTWFFLETNDGGQLLRTPVRRIVSFARVSLTYSEKCCTYFKTLIISFRHASAGHICSHKAMLFPFHVFW